MLDSYEYRKGKILEMIKFVVDSLNNIEVQQPEPEYYKEVLVFCRFIRREVNNDSLRARKILIDDLEVTDLDKNMSKIFREGATLSSSELNGRLAIIFIWLAISSESSILGPALKGVKAWITNIDIVSNPKGSRLN